MLGGEHLRARVNISDLERHEHREKNFLKLPRVLRGSLWLLEAPLGVDFVFVAFPWLSGS